MLHAREWIERLGLQPHPEGGHFRETYRSTETIPRRHLPARFTGDRAFATAIYYLLEGDDFSAFHRIRQDELWHFYEGSPLTVWVIDKSGDLSALRLGRGAQAGEVPQAVVRAGCLFGARLNDRGAYALVGCTVAPGFDFADFEIPTRESLLERYPRHAAIIEQLTRAPSAGQGDMNP